MMSTEINHNNLKKCGMNLAHLLYLAYQEVEFDHVYITGIVCLLHIKFKKKYDNPCTSHKMFFLKQVHVT